MTAERNRPSWLQVAGRLGVTTLSAVVTFGGVGLVALGAPSALIEGWTGGQEEPLVRQVTLTPPDRHIVCAGPMMAFIPQDSTPRGFGSPTEFVTGIAIERTEIASPDVFNERGLSGEDLAAPVSRLRQSSSEAGLAGTTVQTWSTDILSGLVSSACLPPQLETWIPAGSTQTGRQAVLSLVNPGDVPATVDLTLYGSAGEISAPAARGILLPPGTRRVFPLAGFTPEEASPVIHVVAQGSPVQATLHLSVTRGLSADGADVVTGQQSLSQTVFLPGVAVEAGEAFLERRQQEGYADLGPALRLLSPTGDTTARIRVIRPLFSEVVSEAELTQDRVLEFALDELGPGVFNIVVEADLPIVAGARVSAVGEGSTDLSWIAGQPVLETPTHLALPIGPEATLSLIAPSGAVDVTVSRLSPEGGSVISQTRVSLGEADALNRVLGPSGGGYLLESSGPVVAAIVLRGPGQIGHIATAPGTVAPPPVSVLVR